MDFFFDIKREKHRSHCSFNIQRPISFTHSIFLNMFHTVKQLLQPMVLSTSQRVDKLLKPDYVTSCVSQWSDLGEAEKIIN